MSRGAPVDRVLADLEEAEEVGGPWCLSAKCGNLRADWPLSDGRARLCDATAKWESAASSVWGDTDDFPEAPALEPPCKFGECVHGLRTVQGHRFASVCEELRFALRHSGFLAKCPLCFQLVCGDHVRYCMIGDHDWGHKLRCDIIALDARACGGSHSELPFVLAKHKYGGGGGAITDCPAIQSETQFVLSLVNHSSDPWHIYAVTTEPDQAWSLYAVARTRTDVEEMREKEARRLELSFALRLLKKVNTKAATRTFKRGRGRGIGRGRGRGRRQHNDTDSSDLNSGEEEDPPTEADEGGPPLPPPAMAPPPFEQSLGSGASASSSAATPLPPPGHGLGPGASSASSSSSVPPPPSPFLGVLARRGARVESAWGRCHWELAPIWS